MKKCKISGCGKWVTDGPDSEYCPEHQKKIDPVSALYIDKSPEEQQADERVIEFFSYLLWNRSLEELLS